MSYCLSSVRCQGIIGFAALAASALLAAPVVAQQSPSELPVERELTAKGVPLARVYRVEGAPDIDGEVLGEAIWKDALPATGFIQNSPDEGQSASERTEVRIIYNQDTLYFGIICYVRDTSTIIVSDSSSA